MPNGSTAMPDNPMDSSPAETFSASRFTKGNFFFPTKLIVVSPQRVIRTKVAAVWQQRSIPISKSRLGPHFDRRFSGPEIVDQIDGRLKSTSPATVTA